MRYRKLGKTGIFVSEIGLGTMTFGGQGFWKVVGSLGSSEAESLVNLAASDVVLAPAQIAALDEASKLPPEYPGWMIESQNRERRPQGAS